MVYALDSESSGEILVSSNLIVPTNIDEILGYNYQGLLTLCLFIAHVVL